MKTETFDENQSQFVDEQTLKATIASPMVTGTVTNRKVTRPNTLLLVAAICGGILVLFTAMLIFAPEKKSSTVLATPLATSQPFIIPTELEIKLQRLLVDITKADPERSILPLPPVAYDLQLKDLSQVR